MRRVRIGKPLRWHEERFRKKHRVETFCAGKEDISIKCMMTSRVPDFCGSRSILKQRPPMVCSKSSVTDQRQNNSVKAQQSIDSLNLVRKASSSSKLSEKRNMKASQKSDAKTTNYKLKTINPVSQVSVGDGAANAINYCQQFSKTQTNHQQMMADSDNSDQCGRKIHRMFDGPKNFCVNRSAVFYNPVIS